MLHTLSNRGILHTAFEDSGRGTRLSFRHQVGPGHPRGIPFYNWDIVAGTLPDGLTLDSFTGTISGTPTKAGGTRCTIRVRDYDEKAKGIQRELQIKVAE